ncbi:UDP-N-acetylmuramoyl-L-alanine--D-glutamate ligase [Sulfurospirillum sp. 1612]|uniref:UDP-N-acetylmuramoyl-L-alanine--D-glutamate ligase n=1 Tax=Sulfurospirillum sp. 1612 TaxID=3094835 RepID=UPI002F95BDF6
MIALFGNGKTTKAIAKKFKNCLIFDDHISEKQTDDWGNILLPPCEFSNYESQVQVLSPSFPPHHDLLKRAKNYMSEYDFFAKDMPFSIWISGTNGKTTTTQMCDFLLKKHGSQSGGNIGTPLAELDKNAPIWILESSSYMLHYTKIATPDIYLLLPIKPDHLKWHGSFEAYEKAKLAPLSRMKEGQIAIVPDTYRDIQTNASKIIYHDEFDLAKTLSIDITRITFQTPFLLDAILAMAAQKVIFGTLDYDLLNTFKTDVHKLEAFKDAQGRTWVNDSKGTNLDATLEAIKRYKNENLLLILGGDDKGVDLTPLFEMLRPLQVTVFAIGSNTEKIVNFCHNINKPVLACGHLEKAIVEIKKLHTQDTVALLSPAAASLDQFPSYEHRGDLFKKLAQEA